MRRQRQWLEDILDAIAAIRRYLPLADAEYEANELYYGWFVLHLAHLGEAANHLDPALLRRYPEVPWRQIIAMRNLLVHAYFKVDRTVVWRIVQDDLDPLSETVVVMMDEMGEA